jgi:hypothetical protein
MVYVKEEMIAKIMKLIPCEGEFDRMTELCPDDYEAMLNDKPEFPYSQEEVAKMTKEEYRAAFIKWECETANHYVHFRFSYDKFVEWNRKCLDLMDDDELEHLGWLCDAIAQGKVRNMDMESCGEFRTEGLYFNQDSVLVIYNGR